MRAMWQMLWHEEPWRGLPEFAVKACPELAEGRALARVKEKRVLRCTQDDNAVINVLANKGFFAVEW
jgi:hypothetical protein